MMKKLLAVLLIVMTLCGSAQAGMYTGTALDGLTPSCQHNWELISVTREATCTKAGRAKYKCTKCGKTKTRTITKLAHSTGDWTVVTAATCKKKGKMTAVCALCGKKVTYTLPKGPHTVSEWTIVKEPTATKTGKRKGKCSVCGKTVTEAFYPVGTLWQYSDASLIMALQLELQWLGLYNGPITGIYDDATIKAIKKLQKLYHLHVDGIAWPATLAVIGMDQEPGTPIVDAKLSGYKLQLQVQMISEPKASYQPGEKILFKWTVKNTSKKQDAKDMTVYLFNTPKPEKASDEAVTESDTVLRDGSLEGTYEYTVTEGETRFGFVVRGKLKNKEYTSNTVSFRIGIEE